MQSRVGMYGIRCTIGLFAVIAASVLLVSPLLATTKGLNQIVTPDIQPLGVLSVSFQAQHAAIGNSLQAQFELGITNRIEVALLQGLKPGHLTGGVEYGIVQKKSFLLSTGFLGPWTGNELQPFLEAGYLHGKNYFILGGIHQNDRTQALLGWSHRLNPQLQLAIDYQKGSDNFATVGFTYNFTRTLQINPALYVSNSSPHHVFGYAVLTWNVTAWK
jgi:hypothetical protein